MQCDCEFSSGTWAKEAIDIYNSAAEKIGDSRALIVMSYSFGHIVWSDMNTDDHYINWCISEGEKQEACADYGITELERLHLLDSLRQLLNLPEEERVLENSCAYCASR